MRMRHAVMLALTGAVVAACDTRDDAQTEPGLLPGDEAGTTQQQDMMVARGEFQPTNEAQGMNVSGWYEVRQQDSMLGDDGMELRVHLMGLGEGDHAWHIHSGTCESPGPIVLALSDAPAGMGADQTRAQPGTGTQQPATGTQQQGVGTTDRGGIASDLSAGGDGMVEETVTLDRQHLQALQAQGQNLILNVHMRGGDNPGPAIACAPLQLTGAGAGMGTGAAGTGTTGTGTGTTQNRTY
jgi:hypothetical protein